MWYVCDAISFGPVISRVAGWVGSLKRGRRRIVRETCTIIIISSIKFVYLTSEASNFLERDGEPTNMIQPKCKRNEKSWFDKYFQYDSIGNVVG